MEPEEGVVRSQNTMRVRKSERNTEDPIKKTIMDGSSRLFARGRWRGSSSVQGLSSFSLFLDRCIMPLLDLHGNITCGKKKSRHRRLDGLSAVC